MAATAYDKYFVRIAPAYTNLIGTGSETLLECPADAILLTDEFLSQIGASAPQYGTDWLVIVNFFYREAGTVTALDISDYTGLELTTWDPITLVADDTIAVAAGVGDNELAISMQASDTTPLPGVYKFAVGATASGATIKVCEGWVEVKRGIPT